MATAVKVWDHYGNQKEASRKLEQKVIYYNNVTRKKKYTKFRGEECRIETAEQHMENKHDKRATHIT